MKLRSALLVVGLLASGSALAKESSDATRKTATAMAEAADAFLASLDANQRAKGVIPFDDPRRLDWHNIPKPERKGLQLRELSSEQQELCQALLRTALSRSGYDKAVKILSLENNLREGEKHLAGAPLRDPLRYYLTIFGKPDDSGDWGWSFEGHHFSLNFVIRHGRIVGDTPNFWGANPATVHVFVEGGPQAGARTLAEEEQLAFELLNSLDDAQRTVAILADAAPKDYRGPGEPQPPRAPAEGLPAAKMTETQQKILRELLACYCGHLAPEIAAARLEEIDARGLGQVHFAWYGARQPGIGHAYRIQGPTFILELVNVQSDPAGNKANHIHSVWRSLEGDFGIVNK
jgi:hypothetical protein